MINIQSLTFNPFATNTYILSDETGECIIIDPAVSKPKEESELSSYIRDKGLTVKSQVITHYHVDHVLGVPFVKDTYHVGATAHRDGRLFWENSAIKAFDYGLSVVNIIPPDHFVEEHDKITFGNSELEVLLVPGHAAGSICLVNHAQKFIIAGDVLFHGSIGRTDLPTGDFDLLRENIFTKLFTLDDNYTVYPGHGQKTYIGLERLHNPFI
jgi:hydroxyacylglutathione hydrolase